MSKPYKNIQFVENNIYDSLDIPASAWINTTISFAEGMARQIDLVSYENDLSKKMLRSNISFLTKQLLKRIYKEVFRISGEQVDMTTQYFLLGCDLSHDDLLYVLKDLRAVYNGDFTMKELTTWIQKKVWFE